MIRSAVLISCSLALNSPARHQWRFLSILNWLMKAIFVELPAFSRYRANYLDDDGLRSLQFALMSNPEAGDVIKGTGGLRKLRHSDPRRAKGKRSGLRVIYYWWDGRSQFWLFTLYDKNEMADLTTNQKKILKSMLKAELEARQ